ncbi:putative Biotin requiring enzyme [Trypanosoma vivax]|uniref:Putative dihydrolipoamide acetyltransferase n=1 Tax=Trypanosoma vivax (strain Y486) TaxID=1055687 RepID=G0U5N4_TRYVY|nr:putative dihydrolipoamide acetyltransferase [Trypanosoma vivax]KAH8614510.1 putative Biotin requiring enzyme [Trypanosoma vivax]CCC51185.1 putative dihydrolipoamide acetyltransferase [Trypanosoma vivax Y486]
MRRSFRFLVNFAPVYMPALSPSMESGVIVEWKKKVGDLVKENEVFCTVQTDKAVVDFTNTFEAGYLAKIFHQNGENVAVAKTIAVLVDDAADVSKGGEYVPEGEESCSASAPTSQAEAVGEPSGTSGDCSQLPDGVNASPIYMPALSPSMENGVIVEWKKKVGDLVKENEVFCTVQTDKAVVDFTNTFEAGYLAKIFHQNGENVAVAKTIAVLVENAEDIPKLESYCPDGASSKGGVSSSAPVSASAPCKPAKKVGNVKRYGGSLDDAIAASGPGVMRIASRLDRGTLESITPTGKDGRFTKADFVGQPGFNYDDVPPPAEPSSRSAKAAAAAKGTGSAAPGKASAGVIMQVQPVYNFKVSDTTLLQQLLNSMPVPKAKASKGEK